MELAFEDRRLREICESEEYAQLNLGGEVAGYLKRRLADMRAALAVRDLVAGNPREIAGPITTLIAVDLCDGYRIVFCANHVSNPTKEDGGMDWARVSRVRILRIEVGDD